LAQSTAIARARDIVDLGKPRLSLLVIFTAATGIWMAPSAPRLGTSLIFLLATSCLVAAANSLNCWLEIELDALMDRTRNRPLPAGRLEPRTGLIVGITVGTASLATIALVTDPLTTALGAMAIVSYVLIYTPLKRITPWALFVGAVPGALPPLMGWTAATGQLGVAGWFVFAILFTWQLPHFVAISLYLKPDFERAGFRVLPLVKGDVAARRHMFAYSVLLVAVSLAAGPLGLAGNVYMTVAAIAGLGMIVLAGAALLPSAGKQQATRLFVFTIVYLPTVLTALVLNRL